MKSVDLTGERVISRRDVLAAVASGATELVVDGEALLTTTAREALRGRGCTLRRQAPDAAAGPVPGAAAVTLLGSREAQAVASEIVAVGRKLWLRQYVDGNGGNISCRLGDGLVLCTPTLLSKGDLQPEDLCLVDLGGRQLAGSRASTSEIRMHLEIYRAVPQAKAVVHAHPPHATAFAITGRIPENLLIPEFEVFIGQVALTRYETPGTQAFAESVLPHVPAHNTLLLANHGVVCWADSVTHAEWLTEILDTYCWVLQLAAQMRAPLTRIPRTKAEDLLAIKQRLGLPDAGLEGAGAPSPRPASKRAGVRSRPAAKSRSRRSARRRTRR
jgi:L-fuculose-phosphate aldolase